MTGSSIWDLDAAGTETKKPAAGGGAAGFRKRNEQRLGGELQLFQQKTLGRRSGPSEYEALREEVHHFDKATIFYRSAQ
jgi:hypothetical protein